MTQECFGGVLKTLFNIPCNHALKETELQEKQKGRVTDHATAHGEQSQNCSFPPFPPFLLSCQMLPELLCRVWLPNS